MKDAYSLISIKLIDDVIKDKGFYYIETDKCYGEDYVGPEYIVATDERFNGTTEKQIIIWILIGVYTLGGGKHDFGDGRKLHDNEWDMLTRKYPKAKETLPCLRCVWADTRTGRVICFRNCRGYNCFQSK